MSTRERKTKRKPPRLDPILPLPIETAPLPVRQGDGASLLRNDRIIPGMDGLTSRAFHVLWEQAELRAAQNYPRYVGGPMDHAAQAYLEAVVFCRKIAYPDVPMKVLSEERAKKARSWWKKEDKRLAEEAKAKSKKKGKGDPPTPEEESTASEAVEPKTKKKRCASEKRGVRCRGPLDHSGKHRGTTSKGKKVSWT